MGSPPGVIGVALGTAGPEWQAVRGDGEAPGEGEGGLQVDLSDQIHPGGAHKAHVTVGGKEWKQKWEC